MSPASGKKLSPLPAALGAVAAGGAAAWVYHLFWAASPVASVGGEGIGLALAALGSAAVGGLVAGISGGALAAMLAVGRRARTSAKARRVLGGILVWLAGSAALCAWIIVDHLRPGARFHLIGGDRGVFMLGSAMVGLLVRCCYDLIASRPTPSGS